MSAATGVLRAPGRRPEEVGADIPRRILTPVPAPTRRRRPRLAYGILALTGALAIVGAQMLLSVLSTQSSFEISALTQQQTELTWQKQILADDITGLSSPQYLAANATALGMVIDESPSYLRLSDGAILGAQQPAAPASSVDALHRGLVGNNLIAQTPLVTAPDATITGVEKPATSTPPTAPETVTPPTLTEGLPTPATH
ncbi:hypothetical protein [Microbacterium sp. SORGH_AS_0888]|uniref:hypothetical protein n=1 Tax=Microbacterium sp. SORGH_AS_0888 TaxID=3041791 RepID=UPI002782B977|nr:hypothetical protein [Microbacterium sp. SORGH_AS_0888]MDQ1128887.1 hypothetical protein [Microbacterium sp. SORGH_AS_0888]